MAVIKRMRLPRLREHKLLKSIETMPGCLIWPLAIALAGFVIVCPLEAGERLTFEKDVRPIFKAYCLDCHGAGEVLKGHLDLRLKRFAERGGDTGPAVAPGQPEQSLLIERLKSGEMPPGEKKVPAEQIALIERWIADGRWRCEMSLNTSNPGST